MLDYCNPFIVIDNAARKNLQFDVNAADFASLKLTVSLTIKFLI